MASAVMCYFKKTIMKLLIFISTLILFVAWGQRSNTEPTKEVSSTESKIDKNQMPVDIALTFINSYVDNCNKMKESIGIIKWVNSNHLTTHRFKTEVKKMIEEAYKIEPEVGLDADPIFDAQDYPDKGFELESFDSNTNFIVVRGKNWQDFKLTIKMVFENDKWLVDGCGIINIPNDKRIAR